MSDEHEVPDQEGDDRRPAKRARVDDDVVEMVDGNDQRLFVPEPCKHDCRGADPSDIKPHDDEYGRLLPCPQYYDDFPIHNIGMDRISGDAVCEQVFTILGTSEVNTMFSAFNALTGFNDGANKPDGLYRAGGVEKRKLVRHMFRLLGTFALLRDQPALAEARLVPMDVEPLMAFKNMLDLMAHPFKDVVLPERARSVMTSMAYSLLYSTCPNFTMLINRYVLTLEQFAVNSAKAVRISEHEAGELSSRCKIVRHVMTLLNHTQKIMASPPEICIDPNDPDLNLAMTCELVRNILTQNNAILTDTSNFTSVMVALPVMVDGQFYYTYTESMTVSEALQRLRIDASVSHAFSKCIDKFSKEIHTYNPTSMLPLSRNDFVARMRYISFRNGVYCCITGIFFYRRDRFDPRMPANWPFYTEQLEKLNDGRVRAMRFLDRDMRFYEVLHDLLCGVHVRTTSEEGLAHQTRRETVKIQQMDGANASFAFQISELEARAARPPEEEQRLEILRESLPDQEVWVTKALEHFSEWVFNPGFLADMDVLDVRLRSPQKVFGDQCIPRNAYRIWLATVGRCLSGVLGPVTRETNGAQLYMEKVTGSKIDDKLEFATVLIGVAGCGKSEALNQVQALFDDTLVGVMSDHRRPIDMFSTIRGKAMIVAQDYQTDMKDPSMQSGDIKKAISAEALVSDRLHKESIIIKFISHFVFGTNMPLPFQDRGGDMARRFAQLHFRHKISSENQMFAADDDRTVMEMFLEEDIDRFAVVCSWEHRRRLLNVGKRSFYKADKADPHFAVPRYLWDTQAEFIRQQNSISAFMASLGASFSYGPGTECLSVDRKAFLELYTAYCDLYKCEQLKEGSVDQHLVHNYQVRVGGSPLVYHNMSLVFPDTPGEDQDAAGAYVDPSQPQPDAMDDVGFR